MVVEKAEIKNTQSENKETQDKKLED